MRNWRLKACFIFTTATKRHGPLAGMGLYATCFTLPPGGSRGTSGEGELAIDWAFGDHPSPAATESDALVSTYLFYARKLAFSTKGAFIRIAQAKWSELASEMHAWVATRTTRSSSFVRRQSRRTNDEESIFEPTQGDVSARKLALTCPGLGKLMGLRPVPSSTTWVDTNAGREVKVLHSSRC